MTADSASQPTVAHQFWQALGRTDPALIRTTHVYLTYLINRYQTLEMRGLSRVGQPAFAIPLLDLYVPLAGRPFLPEGDAWPPAYQESQESHQPKPVLDLLHQSIGIILLGDPGSGKTTFLKQLALRLALGHFDSVGLGACLPLVLPLAAYADAVQEDGTLSLVDFFEQYHLSRGGVSLRPMVDAVMAAGRALVLLDGLDELTDLSMRHQLVARLQDFVAFQQQQGNRFVITSRLTGYRSARFTNQALTECTLVPLDKPSQAHLLQQWTRVLHTHGNRSQAEAQTEAVAVRNQIETHPAIGRLAGNPLLLTILLFMHASATPQRPFHRATLFDTFVRTSLYDWHLARGGRLDNGRSVDELLLLLAPLAEWMEVTHPQGSLVRRSLLRDQLVAICQFRQQPQPQQTADRLLADMRQHAGLLVDYGGGMIGFLHRSFQTYLAAWAIAQQDQTRLWRQLRKDMVNPARHDLLCLTLGILALVKGQASRTEQLLDALLSDRVGPSETAVLLAGKLVCDLLPGGIRSQVVERVSRQVATTLTADHAVPAASRIELGWVLDQIETPPEPETAVDQMSLCWVPGEPFWLGESHYEQPVTFLKRPFWLGQHPVSNVAFAAFVQAGGYQTADYWEDARRVKRWRPSGEVMDWERHGWRSGPFDYGYPFNLPHHPAVGITWYEAMAFTRWLTERWRAAGWLSAGWQVTLPSELEWEMAGKGGERVPIAPQVATPAQIAHLPVAEVGLKANELDKRPFPWGDAPVSERANLGQHGVATNHPVCFLQTASPVGCVDMCGNVWEWTRSVHQLYPVAESAQKPPEPVRLFHQLVLRGGAFWNNEEDGRLVSRIKRAPNNRSDGFGFRIAVVSI